MMLCIIQVNNQKKLDKDLKLSKYVDPRSAVFVENQTIARLDWNGKPLKADKENRYTIRLLS